MIGAKLYKNNKEDMAKYAKTAIWCNNNNAHIEDKGEYYEVCENVVPEPTKEEKLAVLEAKYKADKADLSTKFMDAFMRDETESIKKIKKEIAKIDADYGAECKKMQEE